MKAIELAWENLRGNAAMTTCFERGGSAVPVRPACGDAPSVAGTTTLCGCEKIPNALLIGIRRGATRIGGHAGCPRVTPMRRRRNPAGRTPQSLAPRQPTLLHPLEHP